MLKIYAKTPIPTIHKEDYVDVMNLTSHISTLPLWKIHPSVFVYHNALMELQKPSPASQQQVSAAERTPTLNTKYKSTRVSSINRALVSFACLQMRQPKKKYWSSVKLKININFLVFTMLCGAPSGFQPYLDYFSLWFLSTIPIDLSHGLCFLEESYQSYLEDLL